MYYKRGDKPTVRVPNKDIGRINIPPYDYRVNEKQDTCKGLQKDNYFY
jgi:hypothetical protein